jgi:hypothetical protein
MSATAMLRAFEALVRSHDVSYNYSDDGCVWRRGQAQRDKILEMAKELPAEEVERIWNARMDEFFIEEEAPRWYWKACVTAEAQS